MRVRGMQILKALNRFWHTSVGAMLKGKAQGTGTLVLSSGIRYEGDWINGKSNDKGILIWTQRYVTTADVKEPEIDDRIIEYYE
jgi:hypothetical protein